MIAYRDADLRDVVGNSERRFCIDAWLKSMKSSHAAGLIDAYQWYAVMIPQLDRIWARPGVRTMIAYNPETRPGDAAGLLGFICAEPDSAPPLVYYVSVKEAYRRMGIAQKLFKAIGISPTKRFDYACKTAVLSYPSTLVEKVPLAKWNPVGARYDRDNRRNSER